MKSIVQLHADKGDYLITSIYPVSQGARKIVPKKEATAGGVFL